MAIYQHSSQYIKLTFLRLRVVRESFVLAHMSCSTLYGLAVVCSIQHHFESENGMHIDDWRIHVNVAIWYIYGLHWTTCPSFLLHRSSTHTHTQTRTHFDEMKLMQTIQMTQYAMHSYWPSSRVRRRRRWRWRVYDGKWNMLAALSCSELLLLNFFRYIYSWFSAQCQCRCCLEWYAANAMSIRYTAPRAAH